MPVRGEGVEIVLQPCRVRNDRFVPVKGSAELTLGWAELVELVAPHRTHDSMRQLLKAEPGSYLGLSKDKRTGKVGTFFFRNHDRTGKIGWALKRDPSIASRILKVYRVVSAKFEAQLTEVAA